MKNIMYCRRTFLATLGILCMTALGILNHHDVSMAIAAAVGAIGAANAYEKKNERTDSFLKAK